MSSVGGIVLATLIPKCPLCIALRGVAMAQLGEYRTAQRLLDRAARGFAGIDPGGRARCLAARGEVALASRDLAEAGRALDAARAELEAQGDRLNALFVDLQRVRLLVLVGAIAEAAALHRSLELAKAPPRLRALADLVGADIAVRTLDARNAWASLARARQNARRAAIPPLVDEVERAARELDSPVARVVQAGGERLVLLDEVEAILRSQDLVVDACRRTIRRGDSVVSFATRPVLLALAVTLAGAVPADASRELLADAAFGARRVNDSTRARLRVEIGRLRRAIADFVDVEATGSGFRMRPRSGASVVVLLPPVPGEASALLALLGGGESWSTSALAVAIGKSQRTVQRALHALRDEGRVEGIERGRSQRWVARPPDGFTMTLLLVTQDSRG